MFYFLPLLIVVTVIGFTTAWLTNQWRSCTALLGVVLIWLILRYSTPTDGIRERTISGTPGAKPLLMWLSFIMFIMVLFFAAYILILGREFGVPLTGYHIALLLVLLITMIGGAGYIERKYMNHKDTSPT